MARIISTTFALAFLGSAFAGAAVAAELAPEVFATVDETVIPASDFTAEVHAGTRRRFYHGEIPAEQMAAFQREIGEGMIERVLLLRVADQRGVQPDPEWVRSRLDAFERRAARNPAWDKNREALLRAATAQLRDESRLRNLQATVEDQAGTPSENELRAYYRANPEKFTEPERFRVSAILLQVDPSAPASAWKAAVEEAADIVARIRGGADFAEMATLRSGDGSAEKGGDMGYLHRGMLGDPAQAAIDTAEIGAVTDPVRLLEGVAIFRVEERPVPRLRPFEEVSERAADLWLRERRTALWSEFRQALRDKAVIHVNERLYLPLPG